MARSIFYDKKCPQCGSKMSQAEKDNGLCKKCQRRRQKEKK